MPYELRTVARDDDDDDDDQSCVKVAWRRQEPMENGDTLANTVSTVQYRTQMKASNVNINCKAIPYISYRYSRLPVPVVYRVRVSSGVLLRCRKLELDSLLETTSRYYQKDEQISRVMCGVDYRPGS